MPVCQFGHFPSAGCTLQEAFLDKKGFVYFFYRAGVFSQCRGNGGQSYQAVTVYVQCLQCELGNLQVDASGAFHLREITHPPEQSVGNTGRSAASRGNLSGRFRITRHPQNLCRTQDDFGQRAVFVIFQVQVDALMPKRARNGAVSKPLRVVAPTRVNGFKSSWMLRADGPLSIMMSIR